MRGPHHPQCPERTNAHKAHTCCGGSSSHSSCGVCSGPGAGRCTAWCVCCASIRNSLEDMGQGLPQGLHPPPITATRAHSSPKPGSPHAEGSRRPQSLGGPLPGPQPTLVPNMTVADARGAQGLHHPHNTERNLEKRKEASEPLGESLQDGIPEGQVIPRQENSALGRLGGSAVEHLPLAQAMILGSRDRVPCRASGMEPASPSACISAPHPCLS